MLYAITDRRFFGAEEAEARQRLLQCTAEWAGHGVAYVQLREKDLPARELVELAREMMKTLRAGAKAEGRRSPQLLVNGRADVALAAGADGVHLPAGRGALRPEEVRDLFARAGRVEPPAISVSCHTLPEVEAARKQGVDCVLFAPVFEKRVAMGTQEEGRLPGTGLALLRQACRVASPVPVFALGGVTADNAKQCFEVGAAGIAAIRMMAEPAEKWKCFAGTAPDGSPEGTAV